MNYQWKRFDVEVGTVSNIKPDMYLAHDAEGEYVFAEDAIKREAELLAQIRELEERTAQSAVLIEKAIGLMTPKEG